MVSQEVSVDVGRQESPVSLDRKSNSPLGPDPMIELKGFGKTAKGGIISKIGKEEEESATFVDSLFKTTITTRQM